MLMQDALYRNDIASNYFGLLDEDEVFHDEGRLPGAGQPLVPGGLSTGSADQYLIQGYQFGYCVLSSRPVVVTLSFFNSYAPCTDPTGLVPTAEFVTTGLPNGGCWMVAFDLTGTTGEFLLSADGGDGSWDNSGALDDFGYSLNINAQQGNGSGALTEGPILSGNLINLTTIGDGTQFQNPSSAGTGVGTEDLFWLVSPVVADGCYFYGGCFPCASLNTVVYGDSGEDTPSTFCLPALPNSFSPAGGRLDDGPGFGTASAVFEISDVPAQPGLLFTGSASGQTPFGCGNLCVTGAPLVRYGPFNVGPMAVNTFSVTIDMSLSSNSLVQYWFRDPANAPACGATFNLTNGVGL